MIYKDKMIYKNITPYRNETSASYPSVPSNTLRFMFSKSDYDPTEAGVGSSGTWAKKTEFPNANVWDWTNSNTDWHEAFKGAFPDAENEVRVIAAGDTSGVTKTYKLFAGVYVSNPGTTGYTLTTRNNVISCVPFDVSNVTVASNMFHGTTLKEIVRFAFNGCKTNQMYSNSYIHDFDDIEISSTQAYGMFSLCFNLVHVGKIKFDPTKLVTGVGDQAASLFYARPSYGEMNIETIEGIEGTENVENFTNFMSSNMKKLKRIGGEIDCTSATICTTMFQSCRNLEKVVLKNLGSSNITSTYLMFRGCYSLKNPPVFDCSNVTDASYMFSDCHALTEIPDYDFSSVTKVDHFCSNSYSVESGILETYNKFLDRGESITSHIDTFLYCGRDTPEGQIALSQIPASWGGTGT